MTVPLDLIDKYAVILEAKNPNIDWISFLNEHISRDERYLMKRIKSLLWVDKQLDYEQKYNNEHWFRYYTHLLNKYNDELHDRVCVLDIPDTTTNGLDILTSIISDKLNVLQRMLCMLGVDYKLVKSYDDTDSVLIPTASVLYSSYECESTCVIPDGFCNICFEEDDPRSYRFKIMIDLMSIFQDISIDDLLQCEYGILHLIS